VTKEVYAYPERKVFGQPRRRERQTLTFAVNRFVYFELNLEIANKWKAAFLKLKAKHDNLPIDPAAFSSLSPRSRASHAGRCLVLLNPFGGKGKALSSFTEQVAPILSESELQYNMIVTERPGHAQELIQSVDLEEWNCVLICSGDGLIFEVINGLMRRFDWRRAIEIPIGVIPCGTGNALAASILWRSGESLKSAALVPSSAFIVTQQFVSPLDLILVETRASRFYSFLSVCYGLIADVDIESEKYRKLGVVRNILGGLVRIFDLRTYRCRISYLPTTSPSGGGRARAESGEQKRRHMSDSILKNSSSDSSGDAVSRRDLKARRRSATEAERMAASRRLRSDDQTSHSLPHQPVSKSPQSTPSPSSSKPSVANEASSDPVTPAFKYSMSVPNGFGVFFEGDDKETSPPPPLPALGNNSNNTSKHSIRRISGTQAPLSPTTDYPAGSSNPRYSLNRSDSGYGSASSESPPDAAKTAGVLPGLEPIVEDEKEVSQELKDNGNRPLFTARADDEDEEEALEEVEGVNNVTVNDVIYDIPASSSLGKEDLPDEEPTENSSAKSCDDDYERIDLTPTRLAKIEEEVPNHWVSMETEIVSANIINISHLSSETVAYTGADINDGQLFIYIIRAGISKAGLLQMLASMDSADAPVESPYVDIIPCDAFRLEPLVEGILTVDGEVIPCSTIQGEVLPGMARVLVGKDKNNRLNV